ncbi:MAG: 3-phosphoshikimate 1-carboxyvinyltransferase, partial [Flavobacterium sp.]
MNLKLSTNSQFTIDNSQLNITGSKSETNRLLLLKALFPNITLANTSNSDDSEVMQKALAGNDEIVDIHHAGTAMRFLTAYFAVNEGREVVMTGSSRMQERPIKILVEALAQLGVEISYEKEVGYPPIRIKG